LQSWSHHDSEDLVEDHHDVADVALDRRRNIGVAPVEVEAVDAGANAIGFNFYPASPRYIKPERARDIFTAPGIRRVGVFVNESRVEVKNIVRLAGLTGVQLHGHETPEDYPHSTTIWKAVRVTPGFSFAPYLDLPIEALLLDGPAGGALGGAGLTFDWKIALNAPKPIIIAGGLDASNVEEAIEQAHPWGVDACSRIESSPGKKDHAMMREFLRKAKAALHT
jgi:phosphoribosylanthranilate isomerase